MGNPIEVDTLPAQMNETDVIEVLDQGCQGLNLIFQVVYDAETLHIYINRPEAERPFSDEILTQMIQRAIASSFRAVTHQESGSLQSPRFQNLHLYSRELGTVEPDWETFITLPSAETDRPETPLDQVSTVVQPDGLESENLEIDSEISSSDLSRYCFTRNQALLTSEILPPNEKIARLVQSFHALPLSDKLSALPQVENFFRANSLLSLDDLNAQTQAWVHQLKQVDPANLRKIAIWMSRYCLNPEAAMSQVMIVLPLAEVTAAVAAPQSLVQLMLATPKEPSLEQYSAAAPARPRAVHEPPSIPFQHPSEAPPQDRSGWRQALFGMGTVHRSRRHP